MAGSIALSLTQRYDKTSHAPLDGGLLYFFAAGTTTPQSAYQDIGLTLPWPNPITLDSGGNVPQLFFDDGYVKFRLTNAAGTTQIAADFVLVLGPTVGGGAAPSVDATTILSTGDLKARYGTGALTGFVRANGRTIGSASSGASERANADTQTLFEFLWDEDPNLTVSTGRGASAAADWAANKNIALPDWRGRTLAFLDDMGNSAAGRLTSTYFGTSAIVLGATGGSESNTLIAAQIPSIAVDVAVEAPNSTAFPTNIVESTVIAPVAPSGGTRYVPSWGNLVGGVQISNGMAGLSTNTGSGAHNNTQPTMLATIYIKL